MINSATVSKDGGTPGLVAIHAQRLRRHRLLLSSTGLSFHIVEGRMSAKGHRPLGLM
jgi:hypothetical protein